MKILLAKNYGPKFQLEGSFMSEKLDGMRAVWIPWTIDTPAKNWSFYKSDKDKRDHVCSGLWSRLGKPIHCPRWFTKGLPTDMVLDGELYAGRGAFNNIMSICKKLVPLDHEWSQVKYQLFDIPPSEFYEGQMSPHRTFSQIIPILSDMRGLYFEPLRFDQIPHTHAESVVMERMHSIVSASGEGLMLRTAGSIWRNGRADTLVKLKPTYDDKAVVVGHTDGKGKYEGIMGALVVRWKDITFELSGMTDAERFKHRWPLGTVVEFKYCDITPTGVPRFARYWRTVKIDLSGA